MTSALILNQNGISNLLVRSTGIGGPSTSIAVEELAQLGISTQPYEIIFSDSLVRRSRRLLLRPCSRDCVASGLKVGCVAAVIVNRTRQEIPDESKIAETEARAVRMVVNAAALLLSEG